MLQLLLLLLTSLYPDGTCMAAAVAAAQSATAATMPARMLHQKKGGGVAHTLRLLQLLLQLPRVHTLLLLHQCCCNTYVLYMPALPHAAPAQKVAVLPTTYRCCCRCHAAAASMLLYNSLPT